MACIVEGKRRPWPSKVIPYSIKTSDFPVGSIAHTAIIDAIKHINDMTEVDLIDRRNQSRYIFFREGEDCSSKIGYRGNIIDPSQPYRHDINCNNPSLGTVVHEICHALGLWHEQSRQDRDDNICIRFGRIGNGKKHNYYRHLTDGIDFGLYDYDSIMHYPRSTTFDTSWVINKQIAGQSSKTYPVLGSYDGNLHMVHLGNSSNDIWHLWFNGNNWTDNVRVPNQQSKASPALANYNGNLHMVHLGDSSNDIWHSWFDGNNWTDNVRIPSQQSKASPALANYNGNLHMVHLGDSSNDIWHSWFDGNNWTDNVRIPSQQSKAPPVLAGYAGNLHMVHIGDSSNNIWHSWFDGSDWSENERIYQESKTSPSLETHNGNLYMSHLGDSFNNIWYSWFDNTQFETILAPTTANIGQQIGLSPRDIEAINFLYK